MEGYKTPLEKVSKALDLWQESAEKQDEASRILMSGPGTFYYRCINEYVEALFDRFAPFKVGDRVEIIVPPRIEGATHGWKHCKHFLIKGAKGIVHYVDYHDNAFCADVVWDDESWIDQNGKKRKVKKEDRSLFKMWESQIKRI